MNAFRLSFAVSMIILLLCLNPLLSCAKDKDDVEPIINPKDGTKLILIPAGEFICGGNGKYEGGEGEFKVNLSAYYIAEHCVTNQQYKKFVDATGHQAPTSSAKYNVWTGNTYTSDLADHPVLNVSWSDAKAYCDWVGLRLPTELEWEKAARGTDGRVYPWGNTWDKNKCRNRYNGKDAGQTTCNVWDYSTGKSPYGCYNMAGNMWEWCADWHDEGAYYRYKRGDLSLPSSGSARVVRGGSYSVDRTFAFRCALRNRTGPGDRISGHLGFRCARTL